jgi:ABC-type antimicrobial peptide transport system permease subunit
MVKNLVNAVKNSLPLLSVVILCLVGLLGETRASNSFYLSPHGFDILIDNINETKIMEHVRFFSKVDSRVTGYPGFFKASNYITEKFEEYGIQPYGDKGYSEFFNVTVPIDWGSWIALENSTLKIVAYPLWPNLINPSPYESPPEGDEVVYVKGRDLESFQYADVKDKFVIIDFSSSWMYRFAVIYGAKGVIFVQTDPDPFIRTEAEQKLALIPLNFPRLFIPYNETRYLLRAIRENGHVHIKSNITWESISVPNVVGYVKGKDPSLSKEAIVISAYYDSWSVIPRLSPGATDALGISCFLEFARYLANNPPDRSVILVALAGHWQTLWGAREFVEKHFNELDRIVAFVGLDLSAGSDTVGVYNLGSSYAFTYTQIVNSRYGWLVSKLFREYLMEMRSILGYDYGDAFVDGIQLTSPTYIQGFPAYQPGSARVFQGISTFYNQWLRSRNLLLDSDPFTVACYGGGFTYYTVNDFRVYHGTPFDTYENIKFYNLWPQVKFIFCTLWGLANEQKVSLFIKPSRISEDWGYATLTVQVSEYNPRTAYYDPVNATSHPDLWRDVIVHFYMQTSMGIFSIVSKVNDEGKAIIHGVKPYAQGFVDAFVVDRTTGNIKWATDVGVFGAPGGKLVLIATQDQTKVLSIFPCASIAVLFSFSPTDFRFIPTVLVYQARAHGPMIRQSSMIFDTDIMAFIQPNTPTEILLTMGERFPIAVLDNSTYSYGGTGYLLDIGKSLILGPQDMAKNIFLISSSRYNLARARYSYTPSTEAYYDISTNINAKLIKYTESKNLDYVYGYSFALWSSALFLYNSVMDLMWQVIITLVFFFFLSIFSTIILQAFLPKFVGLKRIITISCIFAAFQLALSILHPGFSLATNAPMVLLSSTMMVVILPLSLIMINESITMAKRVRESIIGLHFYEVSRSGILAQSISTGVENLKKRKFRTFLAFISIILILFAMVTFTSITLEPTVVETTSIEKPSYDGILVKRTAWSAFPEEEYYALKSFMSEEAVVAPRAWLYAPPLPTATVVSGMAATAGHPYIGFTPKRITTVFSFLALAPEEVNISNIDQSLIKGRWFTEGDLFSVIIPDVMIANLTDELGQKIDVGSEITLWGMNLKVVGIINSNVLSGFRDINNEPITPVSLLALAGGTQQLLAPQHHLGGQIMIIPYRLYKQLVFPSLLMSVAIKPYNITKTPDLAREISMRMSTEVYYSVPERTGLLRFRQWFQIIGASWIIVPTVIAALNVLTILLASVYERRNEVKIYNAVGMSPLNITTMFLAEASVYSVSTAIIGYLLGVGCTAALIHFGLYPASLYPNFSSITILITILIVMIMIYLPAIYPSLLIAKIAVPSLERRWKIPEPKGDVWEISLPFVTTEEHDVFGIFEFISEYLQTYSLGGGTTFSLEEIDFIRGKSSKEVPLMAIASKIRLAPFELGIIEDCLFVAQYKDNQYSFIIHMTRREGYRPSWITSNKLFIDALRKQVLIWRIISPSERERYISKGYEKIKFRDEQEVIL